MWYWCKSLLFYQNTDSYRGEQACPEYVKYAAKNLSWAAMSATPTM